MRLDGRTRVYGIFGYPVEHSASPVIQGAVFSRLGLNAVYVPFPVSPSLLGRAVKGIIPLGLGGVNVTIPHKETVIRYLDAVDPEAEKIGAVNTIVIRKGKLIGFNTDAAGFLASLREDLSFSPRKKRVFLLGAGGAARSVAFALAGAGAERISLTDVIMKRARILAAAVGRHYPRCRTEAVAPGAAAEKIRDSHLLINATPVGMKAGDPLPVAKALFRGRPAVFDLVYNPLKTKLVAAARAAGAKAAGGQGMLVHQGAIAFRLWTGRRPPVALMRKELERFLKKK